MNLIILLSMPLVLAIIVGTYLIVSIKRENKHKKPTAPHDSAIA